jgi:hypothetical protein
LDQAGTGYVRYDNSLLAIDDLESLDLEARGP